MRLNERHNLLGPSANSMLVHRWLYNTTFFFLSDRSTTLPYRSYAVVILSYLASTLDIVIASLKFRSINPYYFNYFIAGCSENAECGVRSAECGVRSAECGVRSAECGVRSAECGVRSAECGVRSAECGVRSLKKSK